jgi:uncharacterized repeat protein (TIGR01451 family)
MTTVLVLARSVTSRTRVEGTLRWAVLAVLGSGLLASAAEPPVHWLHAGAMPPGAIGSLRLHRGGPLSGYFQPVEIRAPQGARISLAMEDAYSVPQLDVALVGMLIGPVYRLQVSDIPNNPGVDLFPTVEVIDRLYPPPGLALRFPIRIELTQDELEMAARGMFVTRVIYVEEPSTALPVQQNKDGEQPWMEARRGDDPLVVADTLGRPVAILRIGGRVPAAPGIDADCGPIVPPVRVYDPSEVCPNPCPPLDDEPSQPEGEKSMEYTQAPKPGKKRSFEVKKAQLELTPPESADETLTVIVDGSPNGRMVPDDAAVQTGPMFLGPESDEGAIIADEGTIVDEPGTFINSEGAIIGDQSTIVGDDGMVIGDEGTVVGDGAMVRDGAVMSEGPILGEIIESDEPPINGYIGGEYIDGIGGGGLCPACPGGAGVFVDGSFVGPSDEYLCDGGDFHSPAGVRADWTIAGLEQEDAIAHYDTLDGRVVVTPSNRVCIYSPRFAAVRRVVNIMAHEQPVFVNQAIDEQAPAKADESQPVVSSLQRHRVAIDLGQQPPSLYRQRQQAGALENLQATMDVYNSLGAYANLQIIRTGIIDNAEKPWLALSIESAITLTGVQAPQVLFNGKAAAAQVGVRQAGVVYQTSGPENPRLRLIKLASCGNALPGEVIEFTLRFDNIGDQEIGNVTIVDNLSTRFEYIPESAKSSIDANFVTTPNENDSSVLRWEIKPPLKAGEGGVLRFRVRVR